MRVEQATLTLCFAACAAAVGCGPIAAGVMVAAGGGSSGGGGGAGGTPSSSAFTTTQVGAVPEIGPGGGYLELELADLPDDVDAEFIDGIEVFTGFQQIAWTDRGNDVTVGTSGPDGDLRHVLGLVIPESPYGNTTEEISVVVRGTLRVSNARARYVSVPITTTFRTPTAGTDRGGTLLTITGSNFAGAMRVVIDGADATVQSVSPTTIEALTPAHAEGQFDIEVLHPDGHSAVPGTFEFLHFPEVLAARHEDADLDGTVTAGDLLVVRFDRPIEISGPLVAGALALPVSGDTLGTNHAYALGPGPSELTVTLGTAPSLTIDGPFDAGDLGAGASSGLDVSATMQPDAIQSPTGPDAVPRTPVDLRHTGVVPGQTLTAYTITVALGDLDGDGDLDLGEAGWNGAGIRLWENIGGTFTLRHDFPNPNYTVSFGDIDGDGDLDVVSPSVSVGVRRNEGGWVFTDLQPLSGDYVKLGDVDRDGDLDVVGGSGGLGFYVAFNDGAGAFTSGPVLGSDYTEDAEVADLDGDGDLDLIRDATVGLTSSRRVERWLGDGAGGFSSPVTIATGDDLKSIAVGDIDDDGDADVVAISALGGVRRLVNDGTGSFGALSDIPDPGSRCVMLADFDADGDLDVITNHRVWLNDGAGGFRDSSIRLQPPTDSLDGATGDIDGDGDLDLIIGYWPNTGFPSRVFRNRLIGD